MIRTRIKHVRFLPIVAALGVALSGCGIRNAKMPPLPTENTAVPSFRETTEPDRVTQTDASDVCDVALPLGRPQTTETDDETMVAETTTEASSNAPSTTVTTTVTTTTSTTVAETTKQLTTTAPSTTKPTETAARTTAVLTSAAAVTAAKKTQAAANSPQAILNRAVLHPQKTNDEALDAAVQKVFVNIFTSGMSTYDKVLACYTYIISHAEYGRTPMTVTQADLNAYQKEQEAWNVLFAKRILNTGKGVCDDYASLFLVMTRAIGLDCYYTHGYTTNTKGETKDHVWDTITVDGVDYIFDAQVEDKQSANGIQYTFFCKRYDSPIAKIYSGYDLAADKAAYNAFRRQNGKS